VYAPTVTLAAVPDGVSCDRCGVLSGAPAAVTTSDALGKFMLTGVPVGANVPLVFQIGKWRRQIMIPNVTACADTPLDDHDLTRLPRTQSEGNIPRIAMSTGGADALECFLRRIGIADSEFTTDTGSGRVHLYDGGGGTNTFMTGDAFSAAATLWSNPTKLATYDMLGFSCEGSISKFVDQKPQTSIDNVVAYANSGGRLLFTHLHFYWLQHAADFNGTASYVGPLNPPPSPATATVSQTSTAGMSLAQWLAGPAVNASTTLGQLVIYGAQHSVTSVNAPTTEWIYFPQNSNDAQLRRSVQVLSFQTPVGMQPAQQCGKVMFADMHVKDPMPLGSAGGDDSDPAKPFPTGCKTNASTPQIEALEALFFGLDACL
jgi:hypothetical protein